jgi:hypothetical protein
MPLLSGTIRGSVWESSFDGRGTHEFMNFVWKAFMPIVAHLGREGKVDRNKKKCGRSQLTVDWKKIATCILHVGTARWNFGRIIYDLYRPTDPDNWRGNQWELVLSARG